MIEKILEDIKNSKDGSDASRVLFNYCLKDFPLTKEQFSIISDIFGDAEIASHSLLHLHSNLVIPTASDLSEVYTLVYNKFLVNSHEVLGLLGSPLDA